MKIFIFFFTCFLLVFLFLFLTYFFSFSFFTSSSFSPFECGFNPMMGNTIFFSMPFFLITIMFLLFDVEILVLCFYPLLFNMKVMTGVFTLIVLFMVLFSTLYEWSLGVISWM